MKSNTASTLTEVEMQGLDSHCNMADGHAYQDLSLSQSGIIEKLPELWKRGLLKNQHDTERDFLYQFARLAESPSILEYPNFRICPSASNSIDIAAAWLKATDKRVALIEPTFDNLFLILKRRDVHLVSVPESIIYEGDLDELSKADIDAVFLVNPNNPTGKLLSESRFKKIVNWCATHDQMVILDSTFRFFYPQSYDQFQLLIDSGISFLSIEDTGKVWPTQDLKASLILFSKDIAPLMNIIYEEIYLCVSNFQLEILMLFMRDAELRGLEAAVWSEVKARRLAFRRTIEFSEFHIQKDAIDSDISVEWVTFNKKLGNDFQVMQHFKNAGLIVLPGRLFYWDSSDHPKHQQFIRFSLLKPRTQFEASLECIRQVTKVVQTGFIYGG